jgi:thymidine kinase
MEEKSQTVQIDEARFEIEQNVRALRSLAEGISRAVWDVGRHDNLTPFQDKAPAICEEVGKMAELVEGFCVLIGQVANRLDEKVDEVERI